MHHLDRNAFTINSFESASRQRDYWLTKTPSERLAAAWQLICAAWNLDIEMPPQMDRDYFSMRKQHADAPEHIQP